MSEGGATRSAVSLREKGYNGRRNEVNSFGFRSSSSGERQNGRIE
jgi:hypothetical protein